MRAAAVRVFIGLGSNLGNRNGMLDKACRALAGQPDITVMKISPRYETAPVGGPAQRKYLNAVAEVRTRLAPAALLEACRHIEITLGRNRRRIRWGPRTIDLDILLYGNAVIRTRSLTIPHPRLCERLFMLQPLNDIAPHARHPVARKTIRTLFLECRSATR